ncbi:hypothetical protein B932_1848 [Gluconobacter oxydans H24]|nr:hypothetical protein B932_1848 [Gluconobacter oxydans H24]
MRSPVLSRSVLAGAVGRGAVRNNMSGPAEAEWALQCRTPSRKREAGMVYEPSSKTSQYSSSVLHEDAARNRIRAFLSQTGPSVATVRE